MSSLSLLLFTVGSAAAWDESLYTRTPAGFVLSHCVHEIPSGAQIEELVDGSTKVTALDGTSTTVPKCDDFNGTMPVLRRRRSGDLGRPLPPNYDGWLAYSAVNISKVGATGGFDAFTNKMSVPDVPKKKADVLYLFPGLQNIDWIPKADPEPSVDFDIIQPVLQYPGSFLQKGWVLKSWYVTLNAGALTSEAIDNIQPGDTVLCNMTRTGATAWSVSGTLLSDGRTTTQAADNARLRLQPWAYNTLECYGCSGCGTFPTKPVLFTENKLYQAGQEVEVPGTLWEVSPTPAAKQECNERTAIDPASGDTTISFQ